MFCWFHLYVIQTKNCLQIDRFLLHQFYVFRTQSNPNLYLVLLRLFRHCEKQCNERNVAISMEMSIRGNNETLETVGVNQILWDFIIYSSTQLVGQTVNECWHSPCLVIGYGEHREVLEGWNVFCSSSTKERIKLFAGWFNIILGHVLHSCLVHGMVYSRSTRNSRWFRLVAFRFLVLRNNN